MRTAISIRADGLVRAEMQTPDRGWHTMLLTDEAHPDAWEGDALDIITLWGLHGFRRGGFILIDRKSQ